MPDWHFLGMQRIENRMFKLDGEKCSQMSTLEASPCFESHNIQHSHLRETLAPPLKSIKSDARGRRAGNKSTINIQVYSGTNLITSFLIPYSPFFLIGALHSN